MIVLNWLRLADKKFRVANTSTIKNGVYTKLLPDGLGFRLFKFISINSRYESRNFITREPNIKLSSRVVR